MLNLAEGEALTTLIELQRVTPSRTETLKRVVLASANAGKIRELNALLACRGMDVVPQSEFAIPSIEETGESFVRERHHQSASRGATIGPRRHRR